MNPLAHLQPNRLLLAIQGPLGHGFADLPGVGQMAPGPNMMMIVSIGQRAGGILGAILVVIAFFGPTSLLTLIVGRLWNRLTKWPWPASIGLLLAGCFTLAKGAVSGLETATIAVAVLLLLLQYKIYPAPLVLGGALIGALSFGPK